VNQVKIKKQRRFHLWDITSQGGNVSQVSKQREDSSLGILLEARKKRIMAVGEVFNGYSQWDIWTGDERIPEQKPLKTIY